jgi:polyisoprenoid-binding protein YceI
MRRTSREQREKEIYIMNRRNIVIGGVVVLLLVAGAAFWFYDGVLGEPEAASGPITAIPLAAEPTAAPAESAAPTAAPAESAAPTAAPAESASAPAGDLRFQIVPDQSTASFILQEDLRGQRVEVVGTTNQVAGELAINPSDLSSTRVGVIQVNVRTLATDDNRRNNAIRNFILNTDTHEFVTFTPTAIEGLSGAGAANTPLTFKISGDLTIRDVTMPVVFDATAQATSADQITGSATTVINRNDFKLSIPSVPFVANVTEEVTLKIDFVAAAVTE